jgi:hypothetical protein
VSPLMLSMCWHTMKALLMLLCSAEFVKHGSIRMPNQQKMQSLCR